MTEHAPHVPIAQQVYARTFDAYNKHWMPQPENNRIFLLAQENYLNDRLNALGHVFLNDVYDALGFERTASGQLVGWFKDDGSHPVDFGMIELDNGDLLLNFNPDGVMYHKLPTN